MTAYREYLDTDTYLLKNGEFIRIRPFDRSYVSDICRIENENFTEPWSERSFYEMADAEFVLALCAFNEADKLVGYVFGDFVVDTGEVLDIAVDKEYKKQGVGGFLIGSLHKILKERKATECFLEVRESNEPAKCLYAKMGYLPIGVRKNYYKNPKENAIVLRKEL